MSCTILPANVSAIRQAAKLLQDGGLVAFPTETVYGLGANALADMAVASIYTAKARPVFNPLIVHVPNLQEAQAYANFTSLAKTLAEAFWPGPFTLVLQRRPDCRLSYLVSAGLDTVALRIPEHKTALSLLNISKLPIAAPSANRSGRISPTAAEHVGDELKDKELLVLDGGACTVGLESTVVDARGKKPVILRHGCITSEDITAACGIKTGTAKHGRQMSSPGMLESHYAPSLPLRLNVTGSIQKSEALLGFGANVPKGTGIMNLSASGSLKEAAANLFAYLRQLDKPTYSGIAVMPVPNEGLGLAINDRLKRAAKR